MTSRSSAWRERWLAEGEIVNDNRREERGLRLRPVVRSLVEPRPYFQTTLGSSSMRLSFCVRAGRIGPWIYAGAMRLPTIGRRSPGHYGHCPHTGPHTWHRVIMGMKPACATMPPNGGHGARPGQVTGGGNDGGASAKHRLRCTITIGS